jgi:large conductance mechanosensitive channel
MRNFVHKGQPPVVIRYGLFLQQIIHLLVLALALFGIVKFINKLRKIAALKRERAAANEPPQPSEPSEDVKLLRDIRDLLIEIKNANVSQFVTSASIGPSSNLINL